MEDPWAAKRTMQHRAVLRDIGANRKWHFHITFGYSNKMDGCEIAD